MPTYYILIIFKTYKVGTYYRKRILIIILIIYDVEIEF